jgi:hypothetical protein
MEGETIKLFDEAGRLIERAVLRKIPANAADPGVLD